MIHWSQRVWGRDCRPIRVPEGDPRLVGAWGMRAAGSVLPDLSGHGLDGAAGAESNEVNTVLGVMRRYGPKPSIAASPLGGVDAFPLEDLTLVTWYRVDPGAAGSQWVAQYYFDLNDSWGFGLWGNKNKLAIFDDIDNASVARYATWVPEDVLIQVAATMQGKENRLLVNGQLVGSGDSSTDFWSSFAGTLYHGARGATGVAMEGLVGPCYVLDEARGADWVRGEYLRSAVARQFYTGWGAHESLVDETAGYLSNTPARIISGTWRIVTDEIRGVPCKVVKCVAAGRLAIPARLFYATPSEAAFGGVRFWLYKGGAATQPRVMFVAENTGLVADAGQLGYYIQVDNTQTPLLRRMTGGGTTALDTGTAGGFPVAEWALIDIGRRYDGLIGYHQNGAQDMSATDLNQMTSNYIVADFDNNDMMGWSDPAGGHNLEKTVGPLREAA